MLRGGNGIGVPRPKPAPLPTLHLSGGRLKPNLKILITAHKFPKVPLDVLHTLKNPLKISGISITKSLFLTCHQLSFGIETLIQVGQNIN